MTQKRVFNRYYAQEFKPRRVDEALRKAEVRRLQGKDDGRHADAYRRRLRDGFALLNRGGE